MGVISSICSCVSAYILWSDSPSIKNILKNYNKNKNQSNSQMQFKNSIIEEITKKRFIKAIDKEDTKEVGILIEEGFPLNNFISEERFCPLHYACKRGSLKIIKIILKKKGSVDINAQEDIEKWTPLIISCINGHLDCVEYLLKMGANSNLLSESNQKAIDYVNEILKSELEISELEKFEKIRNILQK